MINMNDISVNDVHSFLEWLNNQTKNYMGGEFLYDIKGYYKRLKQSEMFDYWIERIYNVANICDICDKKK
jgi:hypothetical protein